MRASISFAALRMDVVRFGAAVFVVVGMMVIPFGGEAAGAVIGASGDLTQPSAPPSSYPVTGGGGGGGGGGPANVSIVEDVALDFAAGPWLKDLVNVTAGGFLSGQNRRISELLTNAGALTWTGWHERIVSRTTVGGGPADNSPGFLFRENSLTLSANYGAGVVPLTQGVDYTIVTTSGPPGSGNGPDWETITIAFAPNRVIEPGDILHIEKDIFEVFGDANIWMPGEAAQIGEYPIGVPEPGGVMMVAIAGSAVVRRRRRAARADANLRLR